MKNKNKDSKNNDIPINTDDLLKQIEALKRELETRYNDYKRALADFVNLQSRTEKEKASTIRYANELILEKMIKIYVDFDQAKEHIKDEGMVKLIDKFNQFLKSEGIVGINPINEPFDPDSHDAIESASGEKNVVVNVIRKGYRYQGKVLLPALVTVGNGEPIKSSK